MHTVFPFILITALLLSPTNGGLLQEAWKPVQRLGKEIDKGFNQVSDTTTRILRCGKKDVAEWVGGLTGTVKESHGGHIIRVPDSALASTITRMRTYSLEINTAFTALVRAVDERLEHDYDVFELANGSGGYILVQIWESGDVEASHFPSLDACHARAVQAVATGHEGKRGVRRDRVPGGCRTGQDAVAATGRVSPVYKVAGHAQHNCQDVAKEVWDTCY